ncbi:MAG: hypothetical protein ACRDSE_19460 [Pseudonocardiaceae bacterium]
MADTMNELREYYDRNDTSAELEHATLEQPDTTSEPMVTYALRLPKPVLDGLRQAADTHNVTVSALMRTWLEQRFATDTAGQNKVISVDDLLALVAERGHPAGGQSAA